MESVSLERQSTLKVQIGTSSTDEVVYSDFVSDSRARTREILDGLHTLVVGRLWAWFWGGLLGLAVLVVAVLAVSRGKTPGAVDGGAAMVCLVGRTRIADGPSSEWHRAKRIPVGVRASTNGPRSRHVVLALSHDSTVRWQSADRCSRGRPRPGWHGEPVYRTGIGDVVALSALDSLRL